MQMSPNAVTRRESLKDLGFVAIPNAMVAHTLCSLIQVLAVEPGRAGRRRLLGFNELIDSVCTGGPLNLLADDLLGRATFPVRAILFDKTPETNWHVPWHQDLAIPVKAKIECEGFSGWSQKEGVWHVNPPVRILEQMVTLRLHLDDCPESNGPLRIIPRSHREGVLNANRLQFWKSSVEAVVCPARPGDVLAISPLLVHSSAVACTASHRRVLHVEYASDPLPFGLEWYRG